MLQFTLLILIFCSSLCLADSANDGNGKEISIESKTYPFTAEELWERIKQVIQVPAKSLSKEKIEEILNVKFQPKYFTNNPTLSSYFEGVYRTERNLILKFTFNTNNKVNTHFFSFFIDTDKGLNWFQPLPDDGLCIERQLATKDILSLGWLSTLEWKRTLPEQKLDELYPPRPPPAPPENESNFYRNGKTGTDSLSFTFLPYPGLDHELDELPSCISSISVFVYKSN